ncbi:hypothetical protein [Pseudonocardia adelaidensis]
MPHPPSSPQPVERSTTAAVVLPGLAIAVVAVVLAWGTRKLASPVVPA